MELMLNQIYQPEQNQLKMKQDLGAGSPRESQVQSQLDDPPPAPRKATPSSDPVKGILSLPTELLVLICEYAGIKTDSHPGLRLHVPPSCYFCTSFPLYEVPRHRACLSLLLCCKKLHHRIMPILYQYLTIAVDLDRRKCSHQDTFSNIIINRTTIHPYVQHVDLMLEPFARGHGTTDASIEFSAIFCRMDPERSPHSVISTLRANLPNLRSVSWTVKMAFLEDINLRTEQGEADLGYIVNDHIATRLSYYRSLPSILSDQFLTNRQEPINLRLWLANSPMEEIAYDIFKEFDLQFFDVEPPSIDELVSYLREHPILEPIMRVIPNVSQLDLFHHLGRPVWTDDVMEIEKWGRLARYVCGKPTFTALEIFEKLLKLAFHEAKAARFWHRVRLVDGQALNAQNPYEPYSLPTIHERDYKVF